MNVQIYFQSSHVDSVTLMVKAKEYCLLACVKANSTSLKYRLDFLFGQCSRPPNSQDVGEQADEGS